MTVTEIKQAAGSWSFRLDEDSPRWVLEALEYFGHIAIIPGRVNVAEYGDNLLTAARYVGVLRGRTTNEDTTLSGAGMAFWLGDEDHKGSVIENTVTLTGVTFSAAITALLPASGSVIAGTLTNIAGTYTDTHQWVTPRKAITYVTDTFGGEWRVNGNATLDAGPVSALYQTVPQAILVRKVDSQDLKLVALPGTAALGRDVADYTTRVVMLGDATGSAINVGTANGPATPYRDIRNNPVVMTRVVSEAQTSPLNINTRAQLVLNSFQGIRPTVSLSTSAYDLKGDVQVGDAIYVYDPNAGFVDTANEVQWNGQVIHPIILRVTEMSWPMRAGWTLAYRNNAGAWMDLSDYVKYESGDTQITVGDLPSSLTGVGGEPIWARPTPDSSIPAAPAFGTFSVGAYQSAASNTTKAAIRANWSIPLNTDGSTVIDGDHYEVRYRVNQVIGYQVKWGALTGVYRWGSLSGNKWGAPISAAVQATPEWLTAFIPWGTNVWTLTELTPGVIYELQIRAVDGAVPAHQGPFSASSMVTTTGDLFAPSTPAAPTVAGSRVSVQLTHTLGKSSGGTYNLEQDLDHLEVHLGGSADFFADNATIIGKLTANQAMLGASIPAVGTFPVEQIDAIWIKVKAVDRTGNKSSASAAVQVTALLIDTAHISDLSVSKLTAGTITAQAILAATMEVGTGGNIQMTDGNLRVKTAANVQVIELGKRSIDPALGYGLTVFNAVTGIPMVRVGELFDSWGDKFYGLSAVNSLGQMVNLDTICFGQQAATVAASGSCTVFGYGDLPGSYGPRVDNVMIGDSGRCLVTISSDMKHQINGNGAAGCRVAYEIDGFSARLPDNTRSLSIYNDLNHATAPNYFINANRHSVTILETGLNAGPHSFTLKYSSVFNAQTSTYQDRTIVVQPF